MKKNWKYIWKKIIAAILIITLLPAADVADCFTLYVEAAQSASLASTEPADTERVNTEQANTEPETEEQTTEPQTVPITEAPSEEPVEDVPINASGEMVSEGDAVYKTMELSGELNEQAVVVLKFSLVEGATKYEIYRDGDLHVAVPDTADDIETMPDIALLTYQDGSVEAGRTYAYRIYAKNAEDRILAESNAVEVTTPQALLVSDALVLTEDMTVFSLEMLRGSSLDLNGHMLKVKKDCKLSNGIIVLNDGSLFCYGNLELSGAAHIKMEKPNDYILVAGNCLVKSTYYSNMTLNTGMLELMGDFLVETNRRNAPVHAKAEHRTVFSGNKKQTLSIPDTYNLGTVELENYSEEGIHGTYTLCYANGAEYSFDAKGRLTEIMDTEQKRAEISYMGGRTAITDKISGKTMYLGHDNMGRLTSVSDSTRRVELAYDELGNLLSLTYPGGEIVRYTYYKNGLLETVKDTEGRTTRYEYDKSGRLLKTSRPNGTEELCTYDQAGRLKEQKDVGGETVLTCFTYTYDAYGNIISIEGTETSETTEGIGALKSSTMTYDEANRLLTYNGETIRYDADGNMTYGPVDGKMTEMVYDCRNRLIKAGDTAYTYDVENNRITMENGSIREEYVNDTVSSSLSRVLVMTSYKKGSNSGIKKTYIYGVGLISEHSGSIDLYHHYNHLGSTVKLTDGSGKLVESYTYGTYGELLSGNAELTRFLYNGRSGVSTDDNGLYYMRQRYYSPEIKRFINQDILTGSIGNGQSLNRYCYVQGNPVSYVDPFGLSPLGDLFNPLTLAHCVFGFLGSVPGPTGFAFGLADAALYYFVDKDPAMAGISLLSAAGMGLGSGAAWLAKSRNMGKTAEMLKRGSGIFSKGANFLDNAVSASRMYDNMYEKYVVQGQDFGWGTAFELVGLGLSVTGAVVSGRGCLDDARAIDNMWKDAEFRQGLKKEATEFGNSIKMNNRGAVDFDTLGGLLVPGKRSGSTGGYSQGGRLSNVDDYVDLTDFRKDHILNNHRFGEGKLDKTEFPQSWSDEKILHYVLDVATDPKANWGMGRWDSPYAIGVREGIEIRVDFYPKAHSKYSGKISTAYPLNTPQNPPKGGGL